MNAVSPVSGAKGAPPAPREFPDTLLVDSTAYIVDVISEGEIEGWATPEAPAKSIFFDGVPLQNAAGDFNFEGVEFTLRTGTESQTPPKGFANVVNEIAVGLKVVQATPVVRTVTDAEVDAVQVKVGTPTLTTLRESGNLAGGRIRYAIDVQEGAGPWVLGAEREIHGKTTSGFERRIRVELPETRPVSVRVRRISDDSPSSTVQDDLFFISITEVIDAKLEYPGTAYVAISFPAEAFGGRIPRRSYAIRGLKCLVPSNYTPSTRAYSGIWDGTFVRAHTDNPAWAWYTALVDERWGLGERVSPDAVDKWALYAIGQYCDEPVDDGKGGTEPRFTFNGPLDRQENAIEVLRMIASAFRGATYWSAGAVVPVADRPSDPVKLVTNANVEEITYSGVPLSARHTAAIVSCRDPGDNYAIKPTAVHDDPALIRRYGRRQRDVTLPFCTSDGEALRAAKWIVETDGRGGERASWRAGFDHAGLRPGDAVLLSDKHRIGRRLGGRVREVESATLIRLDSPIPAALAAGLKLSVSTDVGDFVERSVAASTFTGVTEASAITLTAALPASVVAGAVWFARSDDVAPRRFRILANAPEPDHRFTISAVEEDAGKWARVEQGIIVDRAPPYLLPPAGAPAAPTGLQVVEWARAQPGSRALPVAALGWNSPADPRIDSWQWAALEPAGAWTPPARVYTPSADIPLESGIVDGYRFRVRAATTDGQVSAWAEIGFDPVGANAAPAPPAGLAAASGVARNTVSWAMPDEPDFRHVEVLVNDAPVSGTATVLGRTASTSLPDEGLGVGQTRYYWARTVTHAETNNVSALAGPVSATASGVDSPLLAAPLADVIGNAASVAAAALVEATEALADADAAIAAAAANAATITSEIARVEAAAPGGNLVALGTVSGATSAAQVSAAWTGATLQTSGATNFALLFDSTYLRVENASRSRVIHRYNPNGRRFRARGVAFNPTSPGNFSIGLRRPDSTFLNGIATVRPTGATFWLAFDVEWTCTSDAPDFVVGFFLDSGHFAGFGSLLVEDISESQSVRGFFNRAASALAADGVAFGSEIATAQAGLVTLEGEIDAEVATRTSAVATLTSAIADVETELAAEVATLEGSIAAEATARTAAIATETAARAVSEQALEARISGPNLVARGAVNAASTQAEVNEAWTGVVLATSGATNSALLQDGRYLQVENGDRSRVVHRYNPNGRKFRATGIAFSPTSPGNFNIGLRRPNATFIPGAVTVRTTGATFWTAFDVEWTAAGDAPDFVVGFFLDAGHFAGVADLVVTDVTDADPTLGAASIRTLATTKVDASGAVAAVSGVVSAESGGAVASVEDLTTAFVTLDDGVRAVKSLSATATLPGGVQRVALVALAASPDGSAIRFDANDVQVLANRFLVARPDGSGTVNVFAVGAVNGVSQVGIAGNLLIDGSVLARHLAVNSVTADKINVTDLSAISANLGSIVVGEANIGALAVTTLKIAGEAVTTGKIGANAVSKPYSASGSGNTGNIMTVVMDAPGTIIASVSRRVAFSNSGGTTTLTFRLLIDGAEVDSRTISSGDVGRSDPGAGGEYITLGARRDVGSGNRIVRIETSVSGGTLPTMTNGPFSAWALGRYK